jgi:hypothetical protein
MVDAISANDVSMSSELCAISDGIDQSLVNQLLMFILGCNTRSPQGGDPQLETLKQELTELESSLPPQEGAQLKGMLDHLPTDTSSKNYYTELIIAFTKISVFIASIIPNGLSPSDKWTLNTLLGEQPIPEDKSYGANIALWAARIGSIIASDLPGVLSPSAKDGLQQLLAQAPRNSDDKLYPLEMVIFTSTVQGFLAENIPSSLSF